MSQLSLFTPPHARPSAAPPPDAGRGGPRISGHTDILVASLTLDFGASSACTEEFLSEADDCLASAPLMEAIRKAVAKVMERQRATAGLTVEVRD